MTNSKNKGIVYVLTNPAMPGMVKIGMTTRENVEARMKELYSTGVPVPFECPYACEVTIKECADLEKALHEAFAPNRVNKNREFFRLDENQPIAILKMFNKKEVTSEISAEISNDLTAEDKQASEKIKTSRRPPLNFFEMGIPKGSILTYVNDPSVTVTVISGRKVLYNEEETSLTAIIKEIQNLSISIQPTKFWEYEGQNLSEIYDNTYPIED